MSADSPLARRLVGLLALLVYLTALALPAVTTSSASEGTWPGLDILILGVLGTFLGQLGWFANPLMLWSMLWLGLARRVGRGSVIVAVLGMLLALTSFTWTQAADDTGSFDIVSRDAGFYLWIACAVLLAAAMGWLFFRDNVAQPRS